MEADLVVSAGSLLCCIKYQVKVCAMGNVPVTFSVIHIRDICFRRCNRSSSISSNMNTRSKKEKERSLQQHPQFLSGTKMTKPFFIVPNSCFLRFKITKAHMCILSFTQCGCEAGGP